MLWSILVLLLLLNVARALILPGTGLVSKNGGVQVVIFEHTSLGTGGLVLNQPTPISLRDLNIPRFQAFGSHALMLGCGSSAKGREFNVPVGDMAPWFWIHTCSDISKSFPLKGASGELYMGGNLDEATALIEQDKLDPFLFKFFYKYMSWEGDALEREISEGQWTVGPQDPAEAIRPYFLPVFD